MCENRYLPSISVDRRKYKGRSVGEWLALNPEHADPE